MMKLLKYELRKTLFYKLILLLITAAAQLLFLYGIFRDKTDAYAIGASLLFLIAVTGTIFIGIMSLATLHRDMNSKQGYMLFMTPNSCYRILGGKVIECGLSLMITGLFFFILGMLDISLLLKHDEMGTVMDIFQEFLKSAGISFSLREIAAFVFAALCSWLCTVMTACLADVLSSSLLYGKKGNWVLSVAFFFILTILINLTRRLLPENMAPFPFFLLTGALSLAFSAVMYFVSARLMEKYLSV